MPAAVAIPDETPSLEASAALASLAVVGTALSLVLLFAAVRHRGAGYSLRPIYLSPAVSLAGGALILGDAVSGGLAAGFAMAVVGVADHRARRRWVTRAVMPRSPTRRKNGPLVGIFASTSGK